MVPQMAGALTFGELADQAAAQRENQNEPYMPEEAPDYSSPRSISRYSCQVPDNTEVDAPRYNPGGYRYRRNDNLPVPRYDPYFDPYNARPYFGYDDGYSSSPGWSRRQADQWWRRRR